VKRAASRPFIPCREIIALLSDYIDGSLSPGRARDLEDHLAICPPCVPTSPTSRGSELGDASQTSDAWHP